MPRDRMVVAHNWNATPQGDMVRVGIFDDQDGYTAVLLTVKQARSLGCEILDAAIQVELDRPSE